MKPKFKVWSIELKKHVCCFMQGLLMVPDTGELYLSGQMNVTDRFILRQFTGLSDKNGADLYEGDIISYQIDETLGAEGDAGCEEIDRGEIVFTDGYYSGSPSFQIEKNGISIIDSFYGGFPDTGCVYRLEKIGNIFENPELLGGES